MEKNELTATDKRKLKQYSHNIGSYVLIGKNGLTEEIVKTLDKELERHELVKIRCNKFKDQKDDFAEKLSAITGSTIIRVVGNTILLYRRSKDETKNIL